MRWNVAQKINCGKDWKHGGAGHRNAVRRLERKRNAGKPGFCGAECNGAEQKAARTKIKGTI